MTEPKSPEACQGGEKDKQSIPCFRETQEGRTEGKSWVIGKCPVQGTAQEGR